jgi:D-sedoheptulose 7-phosphate isomerase
MSLFLSNLEQHINLFSGLKELDGPISASIDTISDSFKNGGKLLLCGNGGSASDCQHIAAEFTGRFIKDRKPLAAISLATDTSALTCISNDYSYEEVFARQVSALGKKDDVLIAISTSGNSANVSRAIEDAQAIGMKSISLLGKDGGSIKNMSNISIIVPSNSTARIQEAHILIGHTICGGVEQRLGLVPSE